MAQVRYVEGLGVLLVVLLLPALARAGPLMVAISDWCPYSCAVQGKHRGILVDTIDEVFRLAGVPIKFVELPPARAIASVHAGDVQAIAGVARAVAPDLVYPDVPPISAEACFFTRNDTEWRFSGDSGRRIGMTVGVASGRTFSDDPRLGLAHTIHVNGASKLTWRMIEMLDAGRFDALLEDRRAIAFELKRHGHALLRPGPCLASAVEYIAFAPGSGFAKIFADGMRALRKTGRLNQIQEAYAVPAPTPNAIFRMNSGWSGMLWDEIR